jgi:hypothetical protein
MFVGMNERSNIDFKSPPCTLIEPFANLLGVRKYFMLNKMSVNLVNVATPMPKQNRSVHHNSSTTHLWAHIGVVKCRTHFALGRQMVA